MLLLLLPLGEQQEARDTGKGESEFERKVEEEEEEQHAAQEAGKGDKELRDTLDEREQLQGDTEAAETEGGGEGAVASCGGHMPVISKSGSSGGGRSSRAGAEGLPPLSSRESFPFMKSNIDLQMIPFFAFSA